jgi:hypothetical protein
MIDLHLGFEASAFAEAVARELATPGILPMGAAEHFLSERFAKCVQQTFEDRLLKPPAIRLHPYEDSTYATLAHLGRVGSQLWYPEVAFSIKGAGQIEGMSVTASGFVMEEMDFGYGVKRAYQAGSKQLRTQANHRIRLNHLRFLPELWQQTLAVARASGSITQPYIANPSPNLRDGKREIPIPGHRLVSFDHMLDGRRVFCSCARLSHEKRVAEASAIMADDASDTWPQRLIRLLDQPTYQDRICHLCIAADQGVETAALRYGDNIQAFEDVYIDQLKVGVDTRIARADVQRRLGLSRWKNEAELFGIVKKLFDGIVVQREASPPWLGRQRLDIYVPDLSLALEYQGLQHFEAVALFGGEEGTRRAIERDALKQQLCTENGVTLIHVLHSDPLTPTAIRHRLQRYLAR